MCLGSIVILHYLCDLCGILMLTGCNGDPWARSGRRRGADGGAETQDPVQSGGCGGPAQQHRQPEQQPGIPAAASRGQPCGGRGRGGQLRQPSDFCLRCSCTCTCYCHGKLHRQPACDGFYSEGKTQTPSGGNQHPDPPISRVTPAGATSQLPRESGAFVNKQNLRRFASENTSVSEIVLQCLFFFKQIICLDLSEEMSLQKLESFNG